MQRTTSLIAIVIAALAAPALAEEPTRQLGPHVHGVGGLDIAIDGNAVSLDFHVPGNDILGFEHAPANDAERAALAAANTTLADPLGVFQFPAAAACKVTSAKVELTHGEEHDEAAPAAGGKAGAKPEHEAGGHAGYDNDYTLTCDAPGKITSIGFPYFKLFPRGQKLVVSVTTDKGASKFEATPANPRIDLGGLN